MSVFKTWTDYHHRLNLLFHAIVAMTMLPFVWLLLEVDANGREGIVSDIVITILFLLICLSLAGTAHIYKKKQLTDACQKSSLRAKLDSYLRIQLANYALLEGAALFATLAFYLTASYVFVVVYIFILFIFSLNRPNLERTCRELSIGKVEKDFLADRRDIPST